MRHIRILDSIEPRTPAWKLVLEGQEAERRLAHLACLRHWADSRAIHDHLAR